MRLIYFIGLFVLAACSQVREIDVSTEVVPIDSAYVQTNRIDSIVSPYRTSLEDEMNQVIARADHDFTKGRPNGALNNWATDALFNNQAGFRVGKQSMCLLNVGGLRNPLSKGDITIGDVFRLMPFDNEVVWVEMPISTLPEIYDYLKDRGGEPVSGVKVDHGEIHFWDPEANARSFWIVTSDYLMNGGDNMRFFEKRLSEKYAGALLRDVFIEEVRKQKVLIYNDEMRLNFEK